MKATEEAFAQWYDTYSFVLGLKAEQKELKIAFIAGAIHGIDVAKEVINAPREPTDAKAA